LLKYFFVLLTLCSWHCTLNKKQNITIAYPAKALLGEGAFWNHRTQELYWIDIEGKKLHVYSPEKNQNNSFDMPSRIGTVVPTSKNKFLVALEDGIYNFEKEKEQLTLFSDIEAQVSTNRFNDGKCDPAGRLWAGTMRMDESEAAAKLYSIESDGSFAARLDSITISNGIVWAKDKKTMYYIDTPTMQIRAFDFDLETGNISNERIAVQVSKELGFPDGMAIDENDKLWVGMWDGNAVIQFDPISGTVMKKINVPAHNVTSCAFGGEDFSTLYITSARVDMTEEELLQYPDAGSVFKVDLDVRGVPSSFFLEQ